MVEHHVKGVEGHRAQTDTFLQEVQDIRGLQRENSFSDGFVRETEAFLQGKQGSEL